MNRTPFIAILLSLIGINIASADDWPQWRGPNRDGVWHEQGVLKSFPADGLKIHWRTPVSLGLSSPIVAQGRVFLTDVQLGKPMSKERVLCFDAESGKPLWTFPYDAQYSDPGPDGFLQGPIPTPICRDGKVYAIGKTELHCLDAASGTLVWKKSLDKEYQAQESLTYASPLIDGNLLIIYAGRFSGDMTASLIAIDKDSGKTAWRAITDYPAMSSPIVVSAAGKRQVIAWSQQAVTSIDATTGEVCWREATRPENQSSAVSTPVAQGNLVLIGALMMKLDETKPNATVLWPQTKSPARRNFSMTSTPLLRDAFVYSIRKSGQFVCLDATTGKELWTTDKVTESAGGSSVHITTNSDRDFLFTDRGELILANLTGKEYKEISRTTLIEPTFPYDGRHFAWTPPAYANKCIYARSDKELVCASLAE